MIRTVPDDGIIAFYLDSSETKPIDYIKTGSVTFETDTQDKYFFDEVDKKWYKYTGPWLDFYTKTADEVYCFFGLDSDTKPEGFGYGSMFVEVNTSKAYILSDEGWKEAENPGPTPPGPTPQPVLQDKTVNPTTSEQEVTCDSDYDGLGTVTVTAVDPSQYYKPEVSGNIIPTTSAQVITPEAGKVFNQINVSAVTNSIDNNIQAANIKKDVTILGVVGTYEGEPQTTVDAVITLIDELPIPSEIRESDRARIHSINELYGSLTPEQQTSVTNYSKLQQCEAAIPPKTFDLDFTNPDIISDYKITTDTHIIFHDTYYDILVHCDKINAINDSESVLRGLKYSSGNYFEIFNNSKKSIDVILTFVGNGQNKGFKYGDNPEDVVSFATTPITHLLTLAPKSRIQFTSIAAGSYLSDFYCII